MLLEDDLDIAELEDLSEILEDDIIHEVPPDDPELLKRKHYFVNEIVEDKLRQYIWTNCTNVAIRDSIMSHAPELIKQIIRKQNLHMIYPGQEESAFGDLVQTAWVQVERTLYKFRAKPHCRVCYSPDRPINSALYIPSESEYGIITFRQLFDAKHKTPIGSRKLISGRKCPHCSAALSDRPDVEPKQGTFGGSRTVLFRGNSKVFNMWCLAPDSLLFSDKGVLNIAAATTEQELCVYGNGLTRVIGRLEKPETATIKVQTRLGYKIEPTPEHKLKVLANSGPEWRVVGDLKVGDLIGIQFNQQYFVGNDALTDIVLSKRGSWRLPRKITVELADIIGLFVAEGSYSYNSLRIYNTDKEVINRLVNNSLGLNFRHYPKSQCICLDNARFIEFLKALGFPEHTSASTKFIPARLLRCSRDILCALLSGYADGDGHSNRHNGCTGCTSTSPLLAEQIRMLLLNFGILTKWQKDKRTARTFKISRSGPCNRESKCVGAVQLNSSPYFSERFYDRIGFGITYKQAKRSKLHKSKEQLFGLNDKFRALKAAHGCGSLGYNSMRRVMKAKFCTLDTAISKLRSWDKYADDPNYQFIKQRIAEFTAKKDAIVWLPITSLVASSSPVCELSVEAADHTYIANGFISHNSQVSRTVILAFVKKEGRDRKNAPAYKDHLCGTGRVDEDRMKRFFSEVTQICKHNVDHMRCVDALCRVIKADDKPGDGLIGKLVISSGLSRVQVNNFVRMIRLRSHEFTDSPLSQESDHDKQSRKQFLYQEEE